MKKNLLLFLFLFMTMSLQAQVSKTLICTAGSLSGSLTTAEKNSITNLTLTGIIDARDFTTMRFNMPALAVLDLNNTAIVAYSGNGGPIYLWEYSYPANEIPEDAFSSKPKLKSVILPSSITSIGPSSFYNCTGLITINIPSSVSSIKKGAFTNCAGLTSIAIPLSAISIESMAFRGCAGLSGPLTIPNSVTSIGSAAFAGCQGLSAVLIPSSVNSIGIEAFLSCGGLITVDRDNQYYSSEDGILFNKDKTKLIQCPKSKTGNYTIPSSVTSIGVEAFCSTTNLTMVTIPSSVTSIEKFAFVYCSNLINVDINNLYYSSQDGILFKKDKSEIIQCPMSKTGSYSIPSSVTLIREYAFLGCLGMTSIAIPSSVATIEQSAFSGCEGLTSIVIPSSVTRIGASAFASCTGLTSIYTYSTTPLDVMDDPDPSEEYYIFYNVNKTTCILHVPAGTHEAYHLATQWKDFTNIVETTWSVSSETINVTGSAGTVTLDISTNLAWTVNSDQTWITLSAASGTGNNTLIISYTDNLSSTARTATITLSATGAGNQIITITQAVETVTGVSDENVEFVTIYPNPASNAFQINGLEIQGLVTLTISNFNGTVMLTKKITNNEQISISSFPRGTYIVRINTQFSTIQKKLIKE